MRFLRRPVPAWGSFIIWAGAIWLGSSLSIGPESPIFNILKVGIDKLAHFIEFGILSALAANALLSGQRFAADGESGRRVWQLAVVLTALWAVLDEIHQLWVPSRSTDPLDAVADILGGMVGAWLLLSFMRRERKIPEAVDGTT